MTNNLTRATRDALGLSQAEFASLLGVHVQTLSKRERGVYGVPPETERLMWLLTGRLGAKVRRELEAYRQGAGADVAANGESSPSSSLSPSTVADW